MIKRIKEKILNQQFDIVLNGYNPEQVDWFLDQINEEFDSFIENQNNLETEINNLKNKKNELQEQIEILQLEINNLKNISGISDKKPKE
ncbi:DivIVA domain-containing protein [Mycoplasma sp. 613B]